MNRIQNRLARLLIAALALLTVAACGDSSGPGAPDDPGVLLVPMGQSGYWPAELVWTRDGADVVYAENGLKAVNVSTQIVRGLDASPSIETLARGSAGERIYFGAFVTPLPGSNDNFRISRVHPTSGGTETVTTTFPGDLAVSADERFVVVEMRLYDLQRGVRIDLPGGTPLGFSPDGTQLLYRDVFAPPMLISTADGSSRPLHSTVSTSYIAHRWEGNSPLLLEEVIDYGKRVRFLERDGLTGVTRDIAQLSTTAFFLTANWSPDGRTLGSWVEQGSKINLYVIRSGSAPTIVANFTVRDGKGPDSPVFSPSGNSLAYFYYDDLRRSMYLKSGI